MANTWICEYPERVWITQEAKTVARNILTKTAGDTVRLFFDFGDQAEIVAGDTIASVTSVTGLPSDGATPLTISGKAIDTLVFRVGALFAAGVAGVDYTITVVVVLTSGSTLTRTGILKVV